MCTKLVMQRINTCAYCESLDERVVQRCSKCKATYYCGEKCQLDDWPNHKKVCEKFTAIKPVDEIVKIVSASVETLKFLQVIAHWKVQDSTEQGLECVCSLNNGRVDMTVNTYKLDKQIPGDIIHLRIIAVENVLTHPIAAGLAFKPDQCKKSYDGFISEHSIDKILWPAKMFVTSDDWGELTLDD